MIEMKIFYLRNMKHIAYQLCQSKVKNVIIIITSKTTLIISKIHGKELRQQFP